MPPYCPCGVIQCVWKPTRSYQRTFRCKHGVNDLVSSWIRMLQLADTCHHTSKMLCFFYRFITSEEEDTIDFNSIGFSCNTLYHWRPGSHSWLCYSFVDLYKAIMSPRWPLRPHGGLCRWMVLAADCRSWWWIGIVVAADHALWIQLDCSLHLCLTFPHLQIL